jgi:RNA polymerase sigma-70 factor (ECF subfamily)
MDKLDRVTSGGGILRRANKIKTFRVYPLGECMLEVLSVVQTPDETLICQARAGDRSAREELFRRYRSDCYRCAYRLLGHEQDALDVVQDAMLKAFSALADFDGRSGFRTWLLRIVTNTAYDWGRRRKRRPGGRGGDESPDHEAATYDDPARRLHQHDQRRELDHALNRLSSTLRETFILFAELGLSYKEIAESQNVPIGTVMSRIYAAREKLKAELDWDKLNGL